MEFLLVNFWILWEDDLELEVELKFSNVEVLGVLMVGEADCQVEVGHGQLDLLASVSLQTNYRL